MEEAQEQLSGALGGIIEPATPVGQVTRRLLSYFSSGAMQPGDRLPPERQLATTLGVGRSAVREALAALEILGVVNARQGSGTYLRGRASELLPQTLSWGLLIDTPQTKELIGVRHGLEVQAAQLAARLATPNLLQQMEQQLLIMEASSDYEAFAAADLRFHQLIALASQNAILGDLLQTARSLIRVWVERAMRDSTAAQRAVSDHRALFEAISTRDAALAARVMDGHMQSAAERLKAHLESD
jgi:GntR family transcriptional repressor for pyruvate dehydrogenase complex